jgi:hypothetical protein
MMLQSHIGRQSVAGVSGEAYCIYFLQNGFRCLLLIFKITEACIGSWTRLRERVSRRYGARSNLQLSNSSSDSQSSWALRSRLSLAPVWKPCELFFEYATQNFVTPAKLHRLRLSPAVSNSIRSQKKTVRTFPTFPLLL